MKWLLVLAFIGTALAQSSRDQPAFEAAVVKVNKSGEPFAERLRVLPGGRLELENNTLRDLIIEAWEKRKDEVVGGPPWLASDRFDIIAKAPAGTPEPVLRAMLRSLLKEQFKLTVHEETRVLPVYVLLTTKGGPHLNPPTFSARTFCGGGARKPGLMRRECTNMTMADFAQWLWKISPRDFELPVLDMTGLAGAWDFALDFSPPDKVLSNGEVIDPDGPTVLDAVRTLGLDLDRRKLPATVIVVDGASGTPTAN